jgi:hypothetical protein
MNRRGMVMLAGVFGLLGLAIAAFPNTGFAQNVRGQGGGCKDVGAPLLVCSERPRQEQWPRGSRELYIDDHTCGAGKLKRYTENSRTGAPMESCVVDPRPRPAFPR